MAVRKRKELDRRQGRCLSVHDANASFLVCISGQFSAKFRWRIRGSSKSDFDSYFANNNYHLMLFLYFKDSERC